MCEPFKAVDSGPPNGGYPQRYSFDPSDDLPVPVAGYTRGWSLHPLQRSTQNTRGPQNAGRKVLLPSHVLSNRILGWNRGQHMDMIWQKMSFNHLTLSFARRALGMLIPDTFATPHTNSSSDTSGIHTT